jgi:hypothetical protein
MRVRLAESARSMRRPSSLPSPKMAPLARSCLPSRVQARFLGLAILVLAPVLVLALTKGALADDSRPSLTFAWTAPPECSSEPDVRARVDRILGARSAPHENVDARAVVSKDGEMFRAEIQLFSAGQTSTRHVDDTSCNALADAVALIVALTVNPEAVAEKKETEEKKPIPPPEKKPDEPASEKEPRRPIYFGAGVLLDTATLAALAVGAEIVAGYNPHHAAFELSGTWLAAQDARLTPASSQGASEFALGAGARGCWEIFAAAFDVGPCGGAELGGIFANGFGATQDTGASSVALFRALLGARAKLRFSRFALRLAAEAAIPFTRPSFVIDNAGTVQHVSPATLRTTFGAEIHF